MIPLTLEDLQHGLTDVQRACVRKALDITPLLSTARPTPDRSESTFDSAEVCRSEVGQDVENVNEVTHA